MPTSRRPVLVCTPSRYSLLSGLYAHRHLGWSNHCTLSHGIATFPGILRESGYRTAAVGKMHFTPPYLDVGFDRMQLAEQDGPGRYDDDYPHHPFDPPRPWDGMHDPAALSILPGWTEATPPLDRRYRRGHFDNVALTEPRLRRVMALYCATISQIDCHVGRMVALLEERRLYDRALIVYTSDHGEYLGFHHLLLKGNYMHDPLVRVPLIVKYPESARAGEVCGTLVSNTALAPTLLSCAGCAVPREKAISPR